MKNFLIISKGGDAWCLAQRLEVEGHKAVVYINERNKRRVGDGLVQKSSAKGELISKNGRVDRSVLGELLKRKPDCIIFDMVGEGYGKLADGLRTQGLSVIGACEWGDRVELDRPYGGKVMKVAGIDTPKTETFSDYPTAIRFVEASCGTYVYKPSGNQPTSTTYVAEGPDDMIGMLELYSDIKEEFELQEKIDGVEVSSELWYNGSEVIGINHTFEEKSLMEGGLGPKTGCMGSVVWIGDTKTKLYQEGIGRIVPMLRKIKYRGPIDLNAIVTRDKLYGLEWTARFGYSALFVLFEMLEGQVSELMLSAAKGVASPIKHRSKWGFGVDIAVPPYPLDIEPDLYKDVLIQGFNKANIRHLWLYDVYKKGDRYLCSGNGGDIGAVTAIGEGDDWASVREAKRRVYRTISNFVVPDLMYRRDIGDRVTKDYNQLKSWGWL